MTSKLITYRMQFFIIATSSAIFASQLEPFLASRGISTTTIITVFSITQLLSLVFTIFWSRIVHESNHGHSILRFGYILRVCIIGLMLICFNNVLLICLVLMFFTVAYSLDIANEARVMKWASEENQNFGRIISFDSLGYSLSGLLASVIIAITGKIDYVILFAFFLNLILISLSFYRPVITPAINQEIGQKVKLGFSTVTMLIFVTITMALPGCFLFIMNYHLREGLGLSLEAAVLFSGIAVLLGSGVSEIPTMMYVEKIVEKFGPRNVVMFGLCVGILRWAIASVAHSPLLFCLTFLLQGVFWACAYIGFTTLVKNRLGNDAISKTLTLMSLCGAISAVFLSQIFNYFIQFYDTFMILKFFTIISIVCTVAVAVISNSSTFKEPKNSV